MLLAVAQSGGGEATAADQIREAATLASISLGVLSAFAGQRAASLGRQNGHIDEFDSRDLRRDLLLDLALVAFGLLLLLAAGPLFVAAFDRATPLLRADTAFFGLFCLFYVGVVLVVVWVGATAWTRRDLLLERSERGLLAVLWNPGSEEDDEESSTLERSKGEDGD